MTVRFAQYRLAFYVTVFLISGVVLGLGSYQANIFVPDIRKDFPIFSVVVPALNIFVFLLTVQFATPMIEVIILFCLGVLWLTMGAWSTDVIGYTQCDSVQGTISTKNGGRISAQSYCYQIKVMQAFSWFLFTLFVIAFFILIRLTSQAKAFGRLMAWKEPIRELGWFGEFPGYFAEQAGAGAAQPGMYTPNGGYPGSYPGGYPQTQMAPGMMQPQGGHSIIIQPGVNGAPPTITQVPIGSV